MISPRPKTVRNIATVVIVVSIVVLLLNSTVWSPCGIQHVSIIDDIKTFEETEDPEFCDALVHRILEFNEQCDGDIEILDCG